MDRCPETRYSLFVPPYSGHTRTRRMEAQTRIALHCEESVESISPYWTIFCLPATSTVFA